VGERRSPAFPLTLTTGATVFLIRVLFGQGTCPGNLNLGSPTIGIGFGISGWDRSTPLTGMKAIKQRCTRPNTVSNSTDYE